MRRAAGFLARYWLPILIVVLAVGPGIYYVHDTRCRAEFQQDYRDAQQIRADIAARERALNNEADDNMVRLIRDALNTRPGGGRQLLEEFLARDREIDARRADLDRDRAATPLPDLDEQC